MLYQLSYSRVRLSLSRSAKFNVRTAHTEGLAPCALLRSPPAATRVGLRRPEPIYRG